MPSPVGMTQYCGPLVGDVDVVLLAVAEPGQVQHVRAGKLVLAAKQWCSRTHYRGCVPVYPFTLAHFSPCRLTWRMQTAP